MLSKRQFQKKVVTVVNAAAPRSLIYIDEVTGSVNDLGNSPILLRKVHEALLYITQIPEFDGKRFSELYHRLCSTGSTIKETDKPNKKRKTK